MSNAHELIAAYEAMQRNPAYRQMRDALETMRAEALGEATVPGADPHVRSEAVGRFNALDEAFTIPERMLAELRQEVGGE